MNSDETTRLPILPVDEEGNTISFQELQGMRLPRAAGWPGYRHLPSNKVFGTFKRAKGYHFNDPEHQDP